MELAIQVRPTRDIDLAHTWLQQTTEARKLLATSLDFGMGGVDDIRQLTSMAMHGSVLTGEEFMQIKATLIAAREVLRSMQKAENEFPQLDIIVSRGRSPFRNCGFDLQVYL